MPADAITERSMPQAALADVLERRAAAIEREAAELRALAARLRGDDPGPAPEPKPGWWSVGDAVQQGYYCESIVGNLSELCAALRVKQPRTLRRMVRERHIFLKPEGCRRWSLHVRSRERYIAALKIMAANEREDALT